LLDDPDFADALVRSLLDAGAKPDEVVLEITETAASRNQARRSRISRGFGCAVSTSRSMISAPDSRRSRNSCARRSRS